MKVPVSIRHAVTDLPIPKKLALIVLLFCLVVCGLLPVSYFGMEILSDCRSYVGGESLWSKGEKEAVFSLGHYVLSHKEADYQTYLSSLNIPLGDHEARIALDKPNPDRSAATTGFLRGGNHPKDVPGLIFLFLHFRHVSYIRQAIDIWRQGDSDIAQLQQIGPKIHAEMTSSHPSLRRLQKYLLDVQKINAHVTPLENAFSATFGEGSRWVERVLLLVMLLTICVFLAATLAIAYLISRHLCGEIEHLRLGAAQMANGDYNVALNVDSQDEIGDLSRSFQIMVNHRKKVEKLKDEFYAGVVAANTELEAFSYSVSHDLRAPLRAIDGFSKELLLNCEQTLDERSKSDLQRIRAATQRMGDLIDDLLELSRLSRSELKFETVDLSAQVRDITQHMSENASARTVDYVIAPSLRAHGDTRLLRIALENLLQNSLKFTRLQKATRIEFGQAQANGDKAFFVRDNGVGFSMAYADKLFKPFQRLHDVKEFPGTGIGLALVQRIVHRHGGKVWGEGEENKGATFFFTLT